MKRREYLARMIGIFIKQGGISDVKYVNLDRQHCVSPVEPRHGVLQEQLPHLAIEPFLELTLSLVIAAVQPTSVVLRDRSPVLIDRDVAEVALALGAGRLVDHAPCVDGVDIEHPLLLITFRDLFRIATLYSIRIRDCHSR